jgi:GT2 family glycosyltransferase
MRASIIILTYNQLEECTRPCVESVLAHTRPGEFELILVDNASGDGTPAWLEELARRREEVRIRLNRENRGYAGGNNDGLRLARGEHLVLMNNDVLVGPEWLDRLLLPFSRDDRLGLVGPVTNSVGNEQQVNLPGLTRENFVARSRPYCDRHREVWFGTEKLGFCCVAITAALRREVGLLDEQFRLGMFEDDDYCLRARQAGFRLAVAEGCFIYHQGSASFNQLDRRDYRRTFQENRRRFEAKHGTAWTYSDLLLGGWQRIDGELRAAAADPRRESACLERIRVRFDNLKGLIDLVRSVETGEGNMHGAPGGDRLLEEKQARLMEISDWAAGLKMRLDRIEASPAYRACSILGRLLGKLSPRRALARLIPGR